MKKGDVARAPWRFAGDDAELTGTVTSVCGGKVTVRWHGNGNVTPEGDESVFVNPAVIADLIVVPQ